VTAAPEPAAPGPGTASAEGDRGRGRGRGRGGSTSAYTTASSVELLIQEESRKRLHGAAGNGDEKPVKMARAEDTNAADIAALLGFESFGTTKGKQVESNVSTAARGARAPRQLRKARQYMNRKGGFNQLLSEQ